MKFKLSDLELPYYPEERPEIIAKFLSYCRNRGKLIIDLDKIKSCRKYREIFGKTYMFKMVEDPSKFVAYQSSVALYTDKGEVYPFQIRSEKYFPAYYKVLTETLEQCDFCKIRGYKQTTKIVLICNFCTNTICHLCFEECTSVFFRYNNQFRCIKCKELNFWND